MPPADGEDDADVEDSQPAQLAETTMSASRKRKIDEASF